MLLKLELKLLGARIKSARQKRGFTQEALAELCNFDRTYISLLERGLRNPSYVNLLRLAKGLGTRPADLMPQTSYYDS